MAAPQGSRPADLRLVDAAGRSEQARERVGRRRRETAERRLGGLQSASADLRKTGISSQVRRSAEFAEIDVAELAGERMAAPVQFAEPVAQGLEAGVVDHRSLPDLQASQRLRRL